MGEQERPKKSYPLVEWQTNSPFKMRLSVIVVESPDPEFRDETGIWKLLWEVQHPVSKTWWPVALGYANGEPRVFLGGNKHRIEEILPEEVDTDG